MTSPSTKQVTQRSAEIKGLSADVSVLVRLKSDNIDDREIASLAHRATVVALKAIKDVPLPRQSPRTLEDFISNEDGNE